MTNKQSHWHLASKAKASKFVLEQISSFEADEIDSDDVELRFEIDGRDTGTNVSIVDECAQAAAVIDGLLDELEAKDKRIAELERKEQHSERQSVIDALAGSGEEWSDIEEYMQKWDAARAAAAAKGE